MLSTIQLLKKYDVPGPRYTSYPTVPAWTESVATKDYLESLLAVKSDEPLSLYFHLPFCEKLCHFCGCFKIITSDHSRSAEYMQALLKEIDTVASHLKNSNKVVSQIHLGGGTPNFIQPEELHSLMEKIREHFQISPNAEIAIEMHPRTSTKAFCEQLKKEGFNRISLGVQSFDEKVQTLINRFQTYEQTQSMLQGLKGLGFTAFNFDLIYGLPGQTETTFQDTLEKTLALNPDRLAVYSYAHVPWKSKIQRSFKDEDLPSPDLKLKLYEQSISTFTKNGYVQVGMDHFAKESDELHQAMQNQSLHRNFMGYSTRADAHQIGFGVSSISYVSGNYFQNTKDNTEYMRLSKNSELSVYRGYRLTKEDHIRRSLITEIMCHMRIDIPRFEKQHGLVFQNHFQKELSQLQNFVADGLLEIQTDKIQIFDKGKLTLRNIAMIFDEHLDDVKKNSVNPVFSRTI